MHESCLAVLRTVLPSFDEEVGSMFVKHWTGLTGGLSK